MKHIISVLVENKPGVLARISGLFSSRGFNIESLSVAETLDPTVSRLTLVTQGNEQILEQIKKQLNKLIDTIKVIDFDEGEDYVAREMALIKVNVRVETRSEVLSIVDIFRCKVVDVSVDSYTIEVTGDDNKIQAILDLFKPLGLKEIARTGKAALLRGNKSKKNHIIKERE
ncbi:MAG: acetolactate synthase small subunit [Thermodesulfobacteriota bacterium]|nr:acetolactate synthase small subunit [Thermodesulfobacteriota bacterium]